NVKAPEFKFNPNAAEFTPSSFKPIIPKTTSWAFPLSNNAPLSSQYCQNMKAKMSSKNHPESRTVSPTWVQQTEHNPVSYKEKIDQVPVVQPMPQFIPPIAYGIPPQPMLPPYTTVPQQPVFVVPPRVRIFK